MKRFKELDFDREKKFHKVVKSNKVDKHRKTIYNYLDEKLDDESDEELLDDVDNTNTR